jgi:hypothetical protein
LFLAAGSLNFHWRAPYALKIYIILSENLRKDVLMDKKIDVTVWWVTIDSQLSHLLQLVNAGPIGHRAVR